MENGFREITQLYCRWKYKSVSYTHLDVYKRQALYIDAVSTQELTEEAVRITGLGNPNSGAQLVPWLNTQCGRERFQDIQKAVSYTHLDVYKRQVHIGCLRPLLLQFQPVYHIFQQLHFMAVLSFYHGLNLIIDGSGLQDLL